jgi:phage terminase small subunit
LSKPFVLPTMKLRHRLFVDKYWETKNGRVSALFAGCPVRGADTQACRWLKNAKIAAELARREAALRKKYDVTGERVLAELAAIGFTSSDMLFDDEGKLKKLNDLPTEVKAAISSIEQTQFGPKVRMHSKLEALQLLAKVTHLVQEDAKGSTIQIVTLPAAPGSIPIAVAAPPALPIAEAEWSDSSEQQDAVDLPG